MRSGNAARHERLLRLFERHAVSAAEARLCRVRIEDEQLEGELMTIDGKPVVNFGSCSYLGLSQDKRLVDGVKDAIDRYGVVFASSTAYAAVPLYNELESKLREITGRHVVLPATTTLGHLAVIPTVVGANDAAIVDAQAHSSVHLAAQTMIARGIPVKTVPHNDMPALREAVAEMPDHDKVWYMADGIYSMHGDTAPFTEIRQILDQYGHMWAYIDDAHGFGWHGKHGRGLALQELGDHPRVVVAGSLTKSFGAGASVIAFPSAEMARRVQICGGTLTFSGPVHPPQLGAGVVSADIHLSSEQEALSARLHSQIDMIRDTIVRLGIPAVSLAQTPIWFAKIGGHEESIEVAKRMVADGFYLNLASFPAVPAGQSGLRFSNTLLHTDDQIQTMLERLCHHIESVGLEHLGTVEART